MLNIYHKAIFGVIWKYWHRGKVYLTIKEFQEGVQVTIPSIYLHPFRNYYIHIMHY